MLSYVPHSLVLILFKFWSDLLVSAIESRLLEKSLSILVLIMSFSHYFYAGCMQLREYFISFIFSQQEWKLARTFVQSSKRGGMEVQEF